MKYFLQIFALTFLLKTATAQEKHFVFIQSDNKLPFNVVINGKAYSSTASGYIIIPKLADGEYNATIGFAANSYPEQSFKYVIDKKDLGFNLKNFGEKGWGLFNLQTFAVTMAGNQNSVDVARVTIETPKEEYKPEISFERKKEPPVTKAEDKPVASNAETSTEPVKSNVVNTPPPSESADAEKQVTTKVNTETAGTALGSNDKNADAAKSIEARKSIVKKVAEVKGSMGVYMTYVDENSKDTVQLIIPTTGKKKALEKEVASGNEVVGGNETKAQKKISKKETLLNEEAASGNKSKASKRASKKETVPSDEIVSGSNAEGLKKDDPKFLNMAIDGAKKDSATVKASQTTSVVQPVLNSNCTNVASDQDFTKLKRKMAQETTDEKMINEAKKIFKNKCFTTSQVKGLSTLFLSDEGRYRFFDVSYNFVTDTQLYSSLEKEFIDPSFVVRFKEMLHK